MGMASEVRRARNAGAPIVAVQTMDVLAAEASIVETIGPSTAVVGWNVAEGCYPFNDGGRVALSEAGLDDGATYPDDALVGALRFPPQVVLIMRNLHLFMEQPRVIQALQNVRNVFAATHRTVVLVGAVVTLPIDLQYDVLVLHDPLPSRDEVAGTVASVYEAATSAAGFEGPAALDDEIERRAVDALLGLPSFAAQQAMALAMRRDGINFPDLMARKHEQIAQVRGLSVCTGGESLGQVRGLRSAVEYARRVNAGPERPGVVLWIDEMDKDMRGVNTESSGTSADFLSTMLTWMQERRATGQIYSGVPGSGKSLLAKAFGSDAGVMTLRLDVGALKDKLLGNSEAHARRMFDVVDSVAAGQVFVIATCNDLTAIPSELKRRFTCGTWYFDLPDDEERSSMWEYFRPKYGVPAADATPTSTGWTGAEVESCCAQARRLQCTLSEAADYVIPVAISDAARIAAWREQADGRLLSASYPGRYRREGAPDAKPTRALSF